MPTVPRLEQRVGLANVPNLNVNTDAPAAAFGSGQKAVFDAAIGIAEKAKKDADQLAIMEADRKLSEAETNLLYDQQNGIFNKKGADAFGLPEFVNTEYSKQAKAIEDSLATNEQKAAFRERASGRYQDVNRQVMRHVGEEVKRYDDDKTQAYITTETNAAIKAYHDPEIVARSIMNQKTAIAAYGDRHGLPAELIKQKIEAAESSVHKNVIGRMLTNGDDISAQNYLNNNRDFITGADIEQVEKEVEGGSIRGESQRIANSLISKGVGMSQAIAEVKAMDIKNPKLYDAAIDRVKMEYSIKDAAKRYDTEQTQISLMNQIDKGMSFDQVMNNPAWSKFDDNSRKSLISYAKQKAEGKPIQTDWQSYYDLRTLAENPKTREKFLETNILEYRNSLSDSEFKEMVKLQTGLRKGDSKAGAQLDGYRTDSQVVNDALAGAGIKDKEKSAKFRAAVDSEVRLFQEKTGKKITNPELQSITDNMLTKVITKKGMLWDSKSMKFEAEDIVDVEISDIPKSERAKIEDTLKRRGISVNNDAIVELYVKKLKSK